MSSKSSKATRTLPSWVATITVATTVAVATCACGSGDSSAGAGGNGLRDAAADTKDVAVDATSDGGHEADGHSQLGDADASVPPDGPATDGPATDAPAADGPAIDAPTEAGCGEQGAAALPFPSGALCPTMPVGSGVMRYVSPDGDNAHDGLAPDRALRTVGKAVSAGLPGDVIVVADGIYREGIETAVGGTAAAPLTIRAADGAHPVLTGSAVVDTWTFDSGEVWSADWDETLPPTGSASPETFPRGAPQQVFVDGAPLQQIGGILPAIHTDCADKTEDWCREAVGTSLIDLATHPGSFFYDPATQRLHVRLQDGSSPDTHVMEVSQHRRVFFFYNTTPGFVCLEGMAFRHSNSSARHRQMSAVTVPPSSTFANTIVERMDLSGITLYEQARLVRSIVRDNGQLGVNASARHIDVQENVVYGNNYRRFNAFWEAGGMKLTSSATGEITRNYVYDNEGAGIWLDYAVGTNPEGFDISRNRLHGNGREAQLFVEVSPHARVTNNIILNNGRIADPAVRGIYISESSNAFVAFNTIVRTAPSMGIDALSGSRGTIDGLELRGNLVVSLEATSSPAVDLRLKGPGTIASDFNLFYRVSGGLSLVNEGIGYGTLDAWRTATLFDIGSLSVDPALADPSKGDFTPSPGSPVLQAVSDTHGVLLDHFGTARPVGAGSDIGAIERCGP